MSAEVVQELIGFLSDSRPEARQLAATNVAGLTASDDGLALLKGTNAVECLCKLVGDIQPICELAVKSLINLCATQEVFDKLINVSSIFEKLMSTVLDKESAPGMVKASLMLLSNLTQVPEGAIKLLQVDVKQRERRGTYLLKLLQAFTANKGWDKPDLEAVADPYAYTAYVISNVAAVREGRDVLLDEERNIIPHLLPFLKSPSVIHRLGVARTLKNCVFSAPSHPYLIGPKVNLVVEIAAPLVGPASVYKDYERRCMPPQWLSEGEDKVREPASEVKACIVDTLLMLCFRSLQARKLMRAVKVYPVIREMHTAWRDTLDEEGPIHTQICELVDQLMGDEKAAAEITKEEAELFGEDPKLDEAVQGVVGETAELKIEDVTDAAEGVLGEAAGAAGAAGASDADDDSDTKKAAKDDDDNDDESEEKRPAADVANKAAAVAEAEDVNEDGFDFSID